MSSPSETKLYTRTGDLGTTHLIGGRTAKTDPRITAIGTVDELNAHIGLARVAISHAGIEEILKSIQQDLFSLGGQLALGSRPGTKTASIGRENIKALENAIDESTRTVPALKNFILPHGTEGACRLQVARAVCRRAERCVVALGDTVSPEVRQYCNRLSDLLFALARMENHAAGVAEQVWKEK